MTINKSFLQYILLLEFYICGFILVSINSHKFDNGLSNTNIGYKILLFLGVVIFHIYLFNQKTNKLGTLKCVWITVKTIFTFSLITTLIIIFNSWSDLSPETDIFYLLFSSSFISDILINLYFYYNFLLIFVSLTILLIPVNLIIYFISYSIKE
jgi:hypothetical protein